MPVGLELVWSELVWPEVVWSEPVESVAESPGCSGPVVDPADGAELAGGEAGPAVSEVVLPQPVRAAMMAAVARVVRPIRRRRR